MSHSAIEAFTIGAAVGLTFASCPSKENIHCYSNSKRKTKKQLKDQWWHILEFYGLLFMIFSMLIIMNYIKPFT